MSAGRKGALALSVSAVAAAVGVAAAGGASAPPFAITHLVVPLLVKQNGPREPRKVYREGQPTFPVTVHERGLCPESISCGPRDADGWGKTARAVFTKASNPLVSPGYYFCSGGVSSDYMLGVELADRRARAADPTGTELLGLQDALNVTSHDPA